MVMKSLKSLLMYMFFDFFLYIKKLSKTIYMVSIIFENPFSNI